MEASFSSKAKNELCRREPQRGCCAAAEIYGALLFSNKFSHDEIRIVTENERFSARIRSLIRRVFDIELPARGGGKDSLEFFGADASLIYEHYGYERGYSPALHLNAAAVEDEHCREAFLRGAFLAAGSVSDPLKNYHLELVTRHFNLSREVVALLLDMDFLPKTTLRKSNYVIYFKDSSEIENFLTKCGAAASSLNVMQAKIEKDLNNQINRKVNCDAANISKTVDAAQKQLAAIRRLEAGGQLTGLSENLRFAANLRLEHPDASLTELAESAGGVVGRSGLNHRLTKLVELVENGEE